MRGVTIREDAYDVVVVGAGLSGLAAGIRLRQQGKSVLILEKTDRPGGRAKKATLDGVEFEVGCNQVGKSIHNMMHELGVEHPFVSLKNRFIFTHAAIEFPLTIDSVDTLPELFPLLTNPENINKTLEELTRDFPSSRANVLRGIFAYFLMRSSEKIDCALAQNFLINDYGYDDPRIPVGGMQALVQSMVIRFQSLGGVIQCNAAYQGFIPQDSSKIVMVSDQYSQLYRCRAKTIVSSVDGWSCYPKEAKPSPSMASVLFEMNPDFHYPDGVHTIVFLPDNIDAWLKAIEQSQVTDEFAFHCFKNQSSSIQKNSSTKISVYLFWPQGLPCGFSDFERIQKRILSVMNQHLPGFEKSIVKSHFFPPEAYIQSWGFESVVMPYMSPKGFVLSSYDSEKDIYYVGNAVNAGHEQHIEGALVSAKKAVELIVEKESLLVLASQNPYSVFNAQSGDHQRENDLSNSSSP